MEQYILKSAIAAEIERRLRLVTEMSKSGVGFTKNNPILEFAISEYKDILSFLNTLEVIEVDLEKEIDSIEDRYHGFESLSRADIMEIIKHFFELGLKAQKGE